MSAVSSWRWSFDEDLASWADAGIDHVGLSFRKLEEVGLDRAATRVADAGLRVSNIVEVGWWDLGEPATWAAQAERLSRAVEVAARVGGCLVLTTGPALGLDWDDAALRFADALAPVRADAERSDVAITVEHTGPLRLDLSFVTTFADGVDLARQTGIGVCMEVNSCFAERGLSTTIAAASDVLAHVQVSDFVVGSLCTPDRVVPGDGDVPLEHILGTLIGSGYGGAFELELVGPRIEEEGYAGAIRRAVVHLDALLDRLLDQSSA